MTIQEKGILETEGEVETTTQAGLGLVDIALTPETETEKDTDMVKAAIFVIRRTIPLMKEEDMVPIDILDMIKLPQRATMVQSWQEN